MKQHHRTRINKSSDQLFDAGTYLATDQPVNKAFKKEAYYEIALIRGNCKLHFADLSVHIDQPALIFSSPLVAYGYENLGHEQTGYWCVFSEEFIKTSERSRVLAESPVYKIGAEHIFLLDPDQYNAVSFLFARILDELHSNYRYRLEEIKSYINLIVHTAMKMQPITTAHQAYGSARVANSFLELLENQFPVHTLLDAPVLKKPADFAGKLNVHVNYLNHAVKLFTGKTTGIHIAERMANEAKSLLKHTEWNISEIAYSLGFSYPNHFNHFFKKQAGVTPLNYRR